MRLLSRCALILLTLAATACAATRDPSAGTPPNPSSLAPSPDYAMVADQEAPRNLAQLRYKAVLVAGDSSAAAFDHATEAMRERLVAAGIAAGDIQRLSADRAIVGREGVRTAGLDNVLSAIEQLRPTAGQGCFVFATSHGAYRDGLVLMPSRSFLTPAALDKALRKGCGDAPTVVIVSSCFSGAFTTPPMARANRVILTAARDDRPSFGCGAGFEYTVYDRCLLQAMDHATVWRAAYAMIRACVTARETELGFPASDPRAWFGDAMHGVRVPRG
jgi:hypothetical protein